MNPSIGGFFEVEVGLNPEATRPHGDAYALAYGRSCLAVILAEVRPSKVWLPFYICNSVLEPMLRLKIKIEFYGLDHDLNPLLPSVGPSEMVLYVNYFGMKVKVAEEVAATFGEQAIIDNTHAFFSNSIGGSWSFNSARKFFGVPNGAFLYSPRSMSTTWPSAPEPSLEHLQLRRQGDLSKAFALYQRSEGLIDSSPARIASATEEILKDKIDYAEVKRKRNENFSFLNDALKMKNSLELNLGASETPFCYPYLPRQAVRRSLLAERGIFVPQLWRDCLHREQNGFNWEKSLARDLLALPVDHRYGLAEMSRVLEVLQSIAPEKGHC